MRGKIKYTDEPLGNLRVVHDFLPRPEGLSFGTKESRSRGGEAVMENLQTLWLACCNEGKTNHHS